MKKTTFSILLALLMISLQACSSPSPEMTIDTAVAELESDMNVETAVAQLISTQNAATQAIGITQQAPLEPIPTATSSVCTLNTECQASGISLTVTALSTASEIGYYWKAPEGSVYLVIDVTIKNLDHNESPYNPVWFIVKDGQGREAVGNNYAPLPDLQYGTLTRGGEISGKVSFLVSSDATDFVVNYLPMDPLGGYSTIQVEIGNP